MEVMKMKVQEIDTIRKQFHREWLLIALCKVDDSNTTPLTGRLLAHSPHRDEIYDKSKNYKKPALIVCSEDVFPKGYAAAF